jgi:hypothetical protein
MFVAGLVIETLTSNQWVVISGATAVLLATVTFAFVFFTADKATRLPPIPEWRRSVPVPPQGARAGSGLQSTVVSYDVFPYSDGLIPLRWCGLPGETRMASTSRTDRVLARIKDVATPEVYAQISAHLSQAALDDNNNVNQNSGLEELALLKPSLLREITIGSNLGDEAMDNQNQNQGRLADLLKLKPDALRQIRISLRGEEAMDNQNQNQGSAPEAINEAKPRLG